MTIRNLFAATALTAFAATGCAIATPPGDGAPAAETNIVAELPVVETYATFPFRPGNIGISPNGKMIMSAQPLDDPEVKLVQVMDDGSYKAYPNEAFAAGPDSELKAAIGVKVDNDGVAWVLDWGRVRCSQSIRTRTTFLVVSAFRRTHSKTLAPYKILHWTKSAIASSLRI